MTQEEAIKMFYEAVGNTIRESAEISYALRALTEAGIRLESLSMYASLGLAAAPAGVDDKDFLRKLRITPDLEVRE